MKKSKGQTIDLLYTNRKETVKKSKNKPKTKLKNTVKKKKSKTKKNGPRQERINLDNEIIIGLTPKKEEAKSRTKNRKQNTKTKKSMPSRNKTNKKQTNKGKSLKTKAKIKANNNEKVKRNTKIIKWLILIILLILVIVLFMLSPIFNIKQIVVVNNSKVSSEEIINLSTLTPGVNMFKITNKTIRNNIKGNSYIENVKVKRSINGTVTLEIEERKPTYMIKIKKTYAYINNQGYVLELTKTPLKIPVLIGFSTSNEEIKVGNRLNVEDLNKLDDVIKIMEAAKNSPLANIITKIDISDSNDYKLTVKKEGKIIRIGEMSNINIKLQMAGQVFTAEKGKKGEIYFQEDGKKAIFKEEV